MSEWISVKDGLPDGEKWQSYLVVVKTHGGLLPEGCYRHVEMAEFMPAHEPGKEDYETGNTSYWELDGNEQSIPFEITHWMPLPEMPK